VLDRRRLGEQVDQLLARIDPDLGLGQVVHVPVS
jgi:hypothetical protein